MALGEETDRNGEKGIEKKKEGCVAPLCCTELYSISPRGLEEITESKGQQQWQLKYQIKII